MRDAAKVAGLLQQAVESRERDAGAMGFGGGDSYGGGGAGGSWDCPSCPAFKDDPYHPDNVRGRQQGARVRDDLTAAERRKLGGLAPRANEKVADVIRSRGGSAANVNQAGHWAQKTVADAAKAAVGGDASAESAIKIAKQAGRLGQKH